MRNAEVVGTATGLTEDGRIVIMVLTEKALGRKSLPANIDGIPVVQEVTGRPCAR